MRKLSLIIGITLLEVAAALEFYDFFVTNEGIRYFASQPQRLLYVAAIAIAGGLLAVGINRIPPGRRRTLTLVALGGFASSLSCMAGMFALRLLSFSSIITESGMWGGVATALGAMSVMPVLLWLEFYIVWKRRETGT